MVILLDRQSRCFLSSLRILQNYFYVSSLSREKAFFSLALQIYRNVIWIRSVKTKRLEWYLFIYLEDLFLEAARLKQVLDSVWNKSFRNTLVLII